MLGLKLGLGLGLEVMGASIVILLFILNKSSKIISCQMHLESKITANVGFVLIKMPL